MRVAAGRTRANSGLLAGVRDALPGWAQLPAEAWQQRHRVVMAVAVAHLVVLAGVMAGIGAGAGDWLLGLLPLVGAVVLGRLRRAPRRVKSVAMVLALFNTSLLIVRLAGGATEGHFHFLVLMPLLVLYQDWVTFAAAVMFVLVSHGWLGVSRPDLLYGDATMRPAAAWEMAGVHAGAILAAGMTSLLMWRAGERGFQAETLQVRDEATRQRVLREVAEAATGASDIREATTTTLAALTRQPFSPWQVGHLFLLEGGTVYVDTGVWSPGAERYRHLVAATTGQMGRRPRSDGGDGFVASATADAVRWRTRIDTPAAGMRRREAFAADGLRTGAAIPIVVSGEIAGVLEVFGDSDVPALPARTDMLMVIGVILGRILERQRSLHALAELARRNETLLRSVGEGIVGFDAAGHVTFVNPAAAELLGTTDATAGRPLAELVPFAPPVGAGPGVTTGALRRGGRDIPAEVSVYPLTGRGSAEGGVAIVVDLTERLAAAEAERLTRSAAERQRSALLVNDNVVQGLTAALYAHELGDGAQTAATLERTLDAARGIITDLLAGGDGVDETLLRRADSAVAAPTTHH